MEPRNDSAPWRSLIDRLDVNAHLLRSILSALYELPSVGGNVSLTAVGGGENTNLPIPLPIVAPSQLPVTVENQPISVRFETTQSVTVTNNTLTVQSVPSRTRYFAPIYATMMGSTTIAVPPADQKIRVVAFGLSNNTPTSLIRFRSGSIDLTGPMTIGYLSFAALPDGGLFETGVGQPLVIELSAAAIVGGFVIYELIPS